jgi:endo-1,4-beta-D-glucanase Y
LQEDFQQVLKESLGRLTSSYNLMAAASSQEATAKEEDWKGKKEALQSHIEALRSYNTKLQEELVEPKEASAQRVQ